MFPRIHGFLHFAVFLPLARGVEGSSLEETVDDVSAGLTILVPEEGVDEWVAGSFAVGQALAQNSPVWIDWNDYKQLHQPEARETNFDFNNNVG